MHIHRNRTTAVGVKYSVRESHHAARGGGDTVAVNVTNMRTDMYGERERERGNGRKKDRELKGSLCVSDLRKWGWGEGRCDNQGSGAYLNKGLPLSAYQ